MNQFAAEEFYRLGSIFTSLDTQGREWTREHPDRPLTAHDVKELRPMFEEALGHASSIALKITSRLITEALELLKEGEAPSRLVDKVRTIREIIEKEMDGQLFLYVPTTRAEFYDKDATIFLGDKCRDRFPSVLPEIDEAMKCYAVGRYTACAFHLMRATEAGTKALGDALGAKMRNNNWGDVFKEYDAQLALSPSHRSSPWSTHGEFLENIGANLRGAKILRNGVAHLDESYTEERAQKLMVLIPEFLRKLAERMDEKGNLL